jgi:hypothetical protein
MFLSLHIKEWLEGRILSGAQVYNDMIPPTGRVIYVAMQSGAGIALEGVQDNLTFSVECRGADRNFDDAELIARDVDLAILSYGYSPWAFPDGEYLYFMGRTGGPPAELRVADSLGRFAFTCNYYACVATNL